MTDLALLHGFAATAFTWRAVIEPLRSAGHNAVALDRPWADTDTQVAATVEELDQLGFDHPVIVGHSAGAEIALAVALRTSERVRGLVLLGPVLGRGAPWLARCAARVPGSARVGPAALRASLRFLRPALAAAWHDRTRVTAEVVDGYRRPLLERGVAEALWAMTAAPDDRGETVSQLARIRQPTLVIVGRHDRWATPVETPDSRTVVLDDCGHLPQEEQPARTLQEIERFLATAAH